MNRLIIIIFFWFQKGFSQIIQLLLKHLQQKNCQMKLKSEVKDIEYDGEDYFVKVVSSGKTKIYKTKKLVLAVPKPTLMKLRILKNIKNELNLLSR
jgi:L-2-hydroxyglutarate oxidase LhgO